MRIGSSEKDFFFFICFIGILCFSASFWHHDVVLIFERMEVGTLFFFINSCVFFEGFNRDLVGPIFQNLMSLKFGLALS